MQGGPALSCRRYVRPSLALIPALSYSDKSRNPFATELRGSQRYRSPTSKGANAVASRLP